MDWVNFRNKLLAPHAHEPQKYAMVLHACTDLERVLNVLASHGHPFHVEPGPAPEMGEWPKMMFHVTAAPNGRVVNNEFDLWDLGEGWYDTLEKAQYMEGVAIQFRGRGAVNRKALPTSLSLDPRQVMADAQAAAHAKAARIEEFKRNRASTSVEPTGREE